MTILIDIHDQAGGLAGVLVKLQMLKQGHTRLELLDRLGSNRVTVPTLNQPICLYSFSFECNKILDMNSKQNGTRITNKHTHIQCAGAYVFNDILSVVLGEVIYGSYPSIKTRNGQIF